MTSATSRPLLVFIFPGCMGGVASFYRNIINHTSLRNEVTIKVILLQQQEDKRPRFTDELLADEVVNFHYSTMGNQYHVTKRLSGIIGNDDVRLITDSVVGLNAAVFLGRNAKVIYLVHDYFYINAALLCRQIIDTIIVHAAFFRDVLLAAAGKDFYGRVLYLPYGVELPGQNWEKRSPGEILKLVFLGRLTASKGVLMLKDMDLLLQQAGIPVQWTIIGKGPSADELKKQWNGISYCTFIEANDTSQVYSILEQQDILVFPSQFEGTPVAIMESMSRGVIPVVSDLPGGTRDMVTDDVGTRCETMNPHSYASAIIALYNNPSRFNELSRNCLTKTRGCYDISKASDNYIREIVSITKNPATGGSKLYNVSRLDSSLYPNGLVLLLRKILKTLLRR